MPLVHIIECNKLRKERLMRLPRVPDIGETIKFRDVSSPELEHTRTVGHIEYIVEKKLIPSLGLYKIRTDVYLE